MQPYTPVNGPFTLSEDTAQFEKLIKSLFLKCCHCLTLDLNSYTGHGRNIRPTRFLFFFFPAITAITVPNNRIADVELLGCTTVSSQLLFCSNCGKRSRFVFLLDLFTPQVLHPQGAAAVNWTYSCIWHQSHGQIKHLIILWESSECSFLTQ